MTAIFATIIGVWIALNVAYVAARAFATRKRGPSPTQAGRTLGKLSDAEFQRRKAATTAQLRAELGR